VDKKLSMTQTSIDKLYLMEPVAFSDERGSFSRLYCQEELEDITCMSIKQVNHSLTKKRGTVRGLHFQYEPNAEEKIVQCIRGSVFDVVVDIRKDSPTFLKVFSVNLTQKNKKMIYIPKGFAHGFQTLENDTELLYFHSSVYKPSNEGAIHIKEPLLEIEWPLKIQNLSQRDNEHAFLTNDFEGIEIYEV